LKKTKALVIVESPAKAKTIGKYLGQRYLVKSSVGHVRDLPKSRLGVDVSKGYLPDYITVRGKGSVLKELRLAMKKADKVYLAADHDREGEAIAWHLANILRIDMQSKCRVVFNEITEGAIKAAFKSPRELDLDLVYAQQARRILDRLVGYGISPLLWKKVKRGLSAGRVQSVALKFIVDREQEVKAFTPKEYWSMTVTLAYKQKPIEAQFYGYDGKKAELSSIEDIEKLKKIIEQNDFSVSAVKEGERKRRPLPPFITSTLQQEAARKLNFKAQKTMRIAQQLYEGVNVGKQGTSGLITYMRTDSLRISAQASEETAKFIGAKFGQEYLTAAPRIYKNKKKTANVQDAHEAIRPSAPAQTPESLKEILSRDQYRLYKLIWQRFIASQMTDALFDTIAVDITAGAALFRATGTKLKFAGFTKVMKDEAELTGSKTNIPALKTGELLKYKNNLPKQHFTQPPPRYNEARLVKELEEQGIGRPSTYVPTIETLKRRGYVLEEDKQMIPSELGKIVLQLVTDFFPDIINLKFTAKMEHELDLIEEGKEDWIAVLDSFYPMFAEKLKLAEQEMEQITFQDEPANEMCPNCERQMVYKHGRYGKFLACSGFPECRYTKAILKKMDVSCPLCKAGELVERKSKKRRLFYGCSAYPACNFVLWEKPLKQPCPKCQGILVQTKAKRQFKLKCTVCDYLEIRGE
jgi:DNA topoisomerase-1